MRWLGKQGHRGRGIDLADIALTAYFAEGNEDFARRAQGSLTRYEGLTSILFVVTFLS